MMKNRREVIQQVFSEFSLLDLTITRVTARQNEGVGGYLVIDNDPYHENGAGQSVSIFVRDKGSIRQAADTMREFLRYAGIKI